MAPMEVYDPIEMPRLAPALTPEQRLHLELYGYVLVENTLTAAEVARLRDRTYELEEQVRAGAELAKPAYLHSGSRLFFRIDNLPHLDEAYLDYLTHPWLWGMAEEALGGEARLEQSDVTILRPAEGKQENFGLHRGAYDGLAWIDNGLYHYPFVKTLTTLTDVGPDDGGTVVIPGSHRLPDQWWVAAAGIAAENKDTFVKRVVAPAGSTLLFYESTVHGGGRIRSGQDRMFIVGGYSLPMYQPWHEYDPDPEWLATQPEPIRIFLSGSNRWLWQKRARASLTDPVQSLEDAAREAKERAETARARGDAARAAQRDQASVRE